VQSVEEILTADTAQCREVLVKLRGLLKGLPDLARGLSRVQYGKVATVCNVPHEYFSS